MGFPEPKIYYYHLCIIRNPRRKEMDVCCGTEIVRRTLLLQEPLDTLSAQPQRRKCAVKNNIHAFQFEKGRSDVVRRWQREKSEMPLNLNRKEPSCA